MEGCIIGGTLSDFASKTDEQIAAEIAAQNIELATDHAVRTILDAAVVLMNARRARNGRLPLTILIPEEQTK